VKKYLTGAAITLLVLGLATGAYYFGTQKSSFSALKSKFENPSQITKTEQDLLTTKPVPTSQPKPTINVSEQIVAAMTSKNTQALEGYMAETVQVRLEASGCCGPISKSEAMSQLSYLDPAVGWSFDPTNPTIVSLGINSPDFYGSGWLVGVASNEYIVSFKINNLNKIEAYNLGASYKLLIP